MPFLLRFTILSAILIVSSGSNNKDTHWEDIFAVIDSDREGDVFAVTDNDMEGYDELSNFDSEIDASHLRKDDHPKHYANESVAKTGRVRNFMHRSKKMRKHDDEDLEGNVYAKTDSDMEGDGELSDGDHEIDVNHQRKDDLPRHYANESVTKTGRVRNVMYRSKSMRKQDDEEDVEGNVYAETDSDLKGDEGGVRNDVGNLRRNYHPKHNADDSIPKIGLRRNSMYRSKSMRKHDEEKDVRGKKRRKGDCDDKDRKMPDDSKSRLKNGGNEERNTNKNRKGKKNKKSGDSCQTCGKMSFGKPRQPTYRVISGRMIVPMYKYPWIVNLHHPEYWMSCGGALISATYVLTNARCLMKNNIKHSRACDKKTGTQPKCFFKPNEIKVGLLRRRWKEHWRQVRIEKIIPHEKFESMGEKNNIALIKLAERIRCNELSSPVCLPKSDIKKMGRRLIVAGWGWGTDDSEKETLDRHLREGMMTQIKPEKCRETNTNLNVSDIICVIGKETKQTSCIEGEEGTSIFALFGNKFYSLGILTDQSDECKYERPVTYMKVYSYMDWIKSHVKDLPTPQG